MGKINIFQAAEILGVSSATVRNWIKYKFLYPNVVKNKIYFDLEHVKDLKRKINSGEIERLTKRANKKRGKHKFIPQEYLETSLNANQIKTIYSFIIDNNLNVSIALFYLALNILVNENLLLSKNVVEILKFDKDIFLKSAVQNVLKDWFNSFSEFKPDKKYTFLLNVNLPDQIDLLGLIYQSIKNNGEKSIQGSYFTPKFIAEKIVDEYIKKDVRVLDPCCGTGQFLLSFSNRIKNPKYIYGFDIDPIAVFITKLNLIIRYKNFNFVPNIYLQNGLLNSDNLSSFYQSIDKLSDFDFIMTNPPWGSHFNNSTLYELKNIYSEVKSLESFSYFLIKSIKLLKRDGILSFILPESILNIKIHKDIRKFILDNTQILKIVKLGRVFSNVFTEVIRLDLRNSSGTDNQIKIIGKEKYEIGQKRFLKNLNFNFDIEIAPKDYEIIEKMSDKNFITLKNNAQWALGIVTGDNKKYLSNKKLDGYEEITKGKNVKHYFLSHSKIYIKFQPHLYQQVASINIYRAKEKLIYRFISRKLIFAYDNKQRLTLNSANIFIPRVQDYPIKVFLALLNSSVYQFLYIKKFNSLKVLKGNLEQLPFPILKEETKKQIVFYVDKILEYELKSDLLNEYILDLFSFTPDEKKYIRKAIQTK